jgi:hypothetical protein
MSMIARITVALILVIVIGSIYLNFTTPHTEEQSFDTTLWSELKKRIHVKRPWLRSGRDGSISNTK